MTADSKPKTSATVVISQPREEWRPNAVHEDQDFAITRGNSYDELAGRRGVAAEDADLERESRERNERKEAAAMKRIKDREERTGAKVLTMKIGPNRKERLAQAAKDRAAKKPTNMKLSLKRRK